MRRRTRFVTGAFVTAVLLGGCSAPVAATAAPRQAADELAIMEVSNRFENAFDDGDLEAHLATLSDDIVFESNAFGTYRGKEAYRGWVEPFLAQAQAQGGTRHLMTNFEIEVRGDTATATSYLTILGRTGPAVGATVEFTDELARVDGRWVFTTRRQVVDQPIGAPQ